MMGSVLRFVTVVTWLVLGVACGDGDSGDSDECPAGTYAEGTACIELTACGPNEYESVAPTATSDRQCAALTVCGSDEYEAVPPTATSDRQCAAVTVCDADEYESVAPTPTSDRQCMALTICGADEYETEPPTATSDRQCTALTICGADEYETVPPTATSDRQCTALTVCDADEYEAVPPTATSDRQCAALSTCGADEYESVPATPTSDRECAAVTVCTASEYEAAPPTPTSDRACKPRPFLTSLGLSAGTLDPVFSSEVYDYAADVGLFAETITVTPTAVSADASITVDGVSVASGATSHAVALALGSNPITIEVTSADGLAMETYTVVVDRASAVLQQAYGKASNTGGGDNFGYSVSVSGDTLAVGAPYEDSNATGVDGNQSDNSAVDSGAVYVFTRSGTSWTQQAYLKASNTGTGDLFGYSVSVSGDTLAVGAPYEDSNATGVDGNQNSNSAPNSGAVYVFTRSGTSWTQQAYLKASNTGGSDFFGFAVSLFGDTLAVGATGEASNATGVDGNQADNSMFVSGAVYVFTRSGTSWTQQAYLKASNTGGGDRFGFGVSLHGDTLAVGAPFERSNATGIDGDQTDNSAQESGAVYVFTRSGASWTQQAYIKASNTGGGDFFGYSVSLYRDTLAVGAYGEDSAAGNPADDSAFESGAVYVFARSGTTWTQQAFLKASNTDAHSWFGYSVSLHGDTLAVGAHGEDSGATGVDGQSDSSALQSGAVYVFTRSGTSWTQHTYLKASNTDAYDGFGNCVSLSGDTLAVGAYHEDSSATGVSGNQSDNSVGDSGAVYVFR